MAIKQIQTPIAVDAGTTYEVVLFADPSVWRENGGREIEAVDAALDALARAETGGVDEPERQRLLRAVAEAEADRVEATHRMALWFRTGDLAALIVPADATVWTIQALDDPQRRAAERAAGRLPILGRSLLADAEGRALEAVTRACRGQTVDEVERRRRLDIERARILDGMPQDDRDACDEFLRWRHRHRCELIRRAVVSWRNGPEGYDGPSALADALLRTGPLDDLVTELGEHCETIAAGLHPRGKGSSVSPSGATETEKTSPGSAPTAPPTNCETDEGAAAAPSLAG